MIERRSAVLGSAGFCAGLSHSLKNTATKGSDEWPEWDDFGEEVIEINICEPCLKAASQELRVLKYDPPSRPERPFGLWNWRKD